MELKKTSNYIYLAFVIHIIVTIFLVDEEPIFRLLLIPLIGNLVGLCFLSFTNKIKLGAKIFMFSSFFFVHTGVIGIVGCLKVLNNLTKQDFFKPTKIKSLINKNKILALITINIVLIIIGLILPIDGSLKVVILIPIIININFITSVHGAKHKNIKLAILALFLMFVSSIISFVMSADHFLGAAL
jgi:hypothetical protein